MGTNAGTMLATVVCSLQRRSFQESFNSTHIKVPAHIKGPTTSSCKMILMLPVESLPIGIPSFMWALDLIHLPCTNLASISGNCQRLSDVQNYHPYCGTCFPKKMKQAQVTLESSQDRQLASCILSSHISEKVTQNLSLTLADAISGTISALKVQQTSLNFNSLARVVMSKLITIDFLWASQGGVYASANTPCCTYRNTTGQVEQFLMRLKEKATWLLQ